MDSVVLQSQPISQGSWKLSNFLSFCPTLVLPLRSLICSCSFNQILKSLFKNGQTFILTVILTTRRPHTASFVLSESVGFPPSCWSPPDQLLPIQEAVLPERATPPETEEERGQPRWTQGCAFRWGPKGTVGDASRNFPAWLGA